MYEFFDLFKPQFMQNALLAIILLSPITAILGVHVINLRMAFFADAIGHSSFAGVALAFMLSLPIKSGMIIFAILTGIIIIMLIKKSNLAPDTGIGIIYAFIVAIGLAIISRTGVMTREIQKFVLGDLLSLSPDDLKLLALLFCLFLIIIYFIDNSLFLLAITPKLTKAHDKFISFKLYIFAILLSIVVIFSILTVGILLVTALLIIPAASARILANSLKNTYILAILISITGSIIGFLLSAQPIINTACGATIILTHCAIFTLCLIKKH